MVVFSRREGESIIVGGDIKIEVISVNERGVSIGITVPRQIIPAPEIAPPTERESSIRPQKRTLH